MESVKDKLINGINEISKKYQYYGFWKLGRYNVSNTENEDNPYLYFPSEEYAYKALMEEFDKLTEKDFKPIEGINGFLYFKDSDKLDIPYEVFKQKPKIHIEVLPFDSDEPCGVSVSYKRPENETEIYGRLLNKIVHNARQKYIDTLDLDQKFMEDFDKIRTISRCAYVNNLIDVANTMLYECRFGRDGNQRN